MLNAPLYNAVIEYGKRNNVRFHMPSHFIDDGNLFLSSKYDLTEIEGLDNLMCPTGVIQEAQALLAKTYKSAATFMLTGGASEGVLIALYLASKRSKKVIIESTAHASVYNAIKLFNLEPIILKTRYASCGLPSTINRQELFTALETNEGASVVITSPNYFGRVFDGNGLKDKVKGLLIVDGAHGAHFPFSKRFKNAGYEWADLTVCGMHKTLPCYTGAAILNVKDESLVRETDEARKLFQSTSPSYLIMASIDYARAYMEERGEELYESLYNAVAPIKRRITDDFTRVIIDGENGYELERYLASHAINCEFSFGRHVVLITKPYDEKGLEILNAFIKRFRPSSTADVMPDFNAVAEMNYLSAINADSEYVPLDLAVGRVAAENVGLYPPASPVIIAGERIIKEQIEFIKKQEYGVFGLASNAVRVLK